MSKQLTLFNEQTQPKAKKAPRGNSQNPIVFRDYDSFIAKFTENPRTTDECWTPQDVYEAVVRYVGTVTDLTGKEILRPFYPGGDYINAEYPDNGVVIDNPPFSMFTKIVRFYSENNIPFFLFGPGMTIFSACRWCTAVIINGNVEFTNGAKVRLNFASNLYGDLLAVTAGKLGRAIAACPSQNVKANLPVYVYPAALVSVSDMQIIAKGAEDFAIRRDEALIVGTLDNHPKGKRALFGEHLMLKEAAKEAAKEPAKRAIHIQLSDREKRMLNR